MNKRICSACYAYIDGATNISPISSATSSISSAAISLAASLMPSPMVRFIPHIHICLLIPIPTNGNWHVICHGYE
jgi:hypothetical protein